MAGMDMPRLALVCAFASLLLSSAADAQPSQSATAAFKAGSAAYTRGDLERARVSFGRAVQLAPRVSAGRVALGAVLRELNRLPEAEKELQTALTLAPGEPTALLNFAIVEARLGRNTEAVNAYNKLHEQPVDAGDDIPAAAIPLAAALVATSHSDQANELLTRALAANPAEATLADALGSLLAGEGRYEDAEQQLQHALTLDPNLALTHFHLGSVLLGRRQPAEAVAELERAHTLEPANPAYTLQLAQALLLTAAVDTAITLLRDALATTPAGPQAVEIRYRLALALQSEGRIQEAQPLFAQVLTARPADADVLTNAALAQVQLGRAPAGIALYRRALAAAAPTATLREDLGVAYLQQGDQNDALEQFRLGVALEPENPQLHYDLGLALKLKDDLAGAVPEFEKAALLDPTLPDPPYTLGVIYMQQGRFADAVANLSRATALRPDNGDAWATLGSVYRQLGQPDKAEPALRKAIELLPSQPSPHITLATLLAAQDKREEAAVERKLGADLTRLAVSRQKAQFLTDSGNLLLKRGQIPEALAQLQEAVAADPSYPAAHAALAEALQRAGRKADAGKEREKGVEH